MLVQKIFLDKSTKAIDLMARLKVIDAYITMRNNKLMLIPHANENFPIEIVIDHGKLEDAYDEPVPYSATCDHNWEPHMSGLFTERCNRCGLERPKVSTEVIESVSADNRSSREKGNTSSVCPSVTGGVHSWRDYHGVAGVESCIHCGVGRKVGCDGCDE